MSLARRSADYSQSHLVRDFPALDHDVRVHVHKYGWIKVFWTVDLQGNVENWVMGNLEITSQGLIIYANPA
jgi:hypothetical protein